MTDPPEPYSLKSLNKINLMRKILGRFLIKDQMFQPLLKEYLGSCIVSSDEADKGLLWYQVGKNFTIICFINQSLLKEDIPSRLLSNRYKKKKKKIKIGSYNLITQKLYRMFVA